MTEKERKSPMMPLLTIPSSDRRQERPFRDSNKILINLSNIILETPRLSLIPVTKVASFNEKLSDPLNEYVKSKELSGWKMEFESFGFGLWCIHSEVNPSALSSSSSTSINRLSLNLADDVNFKLPPPSPASSSAQVQLMPIGYIHLSKDSFINLGIFNRYTSQGFATEALKKLLSVIFTFNHIPKELVHVKVDNDVVARVVEKLGFTEKEDGVFSISKSDFNELWYSEDSEDF